jgi:hypothetical protein
VAAPQLTGLDGELPDSFFKKTKNKKQKTKNKKIKQ